MGKKWRKVSNCVKWSPEGGQELEGIYLHFEKTKGRFGDYKRHLFKTSEGTMFISGAMLDILLLAVETGTTVRIVCKGATKTASGFPMNTYEVYTEEHNHDAGD